MNRLTQRQTDGEGVGDRAGKRVTAAKCENIRMTSEGSVTGRVVLEGTCTCRTSQCARKVQFEFLSSKVAGSGSSKRERNSAARAGARCH